MEETNADDTVEQSVEETEKLNDVNIVENTDVNIVDNIETDTKRKSSEQSKKSYVFTIDNMYELLVKVFGNNRVARIKGHCGCTVKNDSGNIMYEFYVRKFDSSVRFYTRQKYYEKLHIKSVNWTINEKFNLPYQFVTSYTDVTEKFLNQFNISV